MLLRRTEEGAELLEEASPPLSSAMVDFYRLVAIDAILGVCKVLQGNIAEESI